MKVYFIRHGESEYNLKHLINFTPSVPVNLTEKGKKQIKNLVKKLKGKKFGIIFASEFIRTQESAAILASALNCKVKVDKRLNELIAGKEGSTSNYYENLLHVFENEKDAHLNGNESYLDVKNRVLNFRKSLEKSNYKNVLVVTHEMVCMTARSVFGKWSDAETITKPVQNAEILRFKI